LIRGQGDDWGLVILACYVCGKKFEVGDPVLVVIEGNFGVMQIGEKVVSHTECVKAEMDKLLVKKVV
jgi:hypothetical protein